MNNGVQSFLILQDIHIQKSVKSVHNSKIWLFKFVKINIVYQKDFENCIDRY